MKSTDTRNARKEHGRIRYLHDASIYFIVGLLACCAAAEAQQPATALAPAPSREDTASQARSATDAFSMADSEAWVGRELPKLGAGELIMTDGRSRVSVTHEIEHAALSQCTLTVRTARRPSGAPRFFSTYTVTLKDLDIARLETREADVPAGYTANKPTFVVTLVAAPDRGKPFTSTWGKDKNSQPVDKVNLSVRDMAAADSLTNVVRRAALACGAAAQAPVSFNAEAATQPKTATAPPSATAGDTQSMTNADIVQLSGAGLSDDVIIMSISQAPARTFDLTPAALIMLKKSNVSDAVIAAMQKSNRVGPSTSSPDKKTSKYDPSLAVAPATAPAPSPCEGMELLGIHKEDMRPVAPLIVWMAKIRNGTSVTRIVTLRWLNMYAEELQSTVEIGAGQIATLKLAAQEPFQRQPIDLRLSSCR